VLQEGEVRPGLPLTLLERPCPEWTVAQATAVLRNRTHNRAAARELAACELLAASWRTYLGGGR